MKPGYVYVWLTVDGHQNEEYLYAFAILVFISPDNRTNFIGINFINLSKKVEMNENKEKFLFQFILKVLTC
ncbi:hypothetical protein BLOT_004298 [Blomia tropicalis]|nr:hypothetical protein BLOT_004298 [Blomia tropicalis]